MNIVSIIRRISALPGVRQHALPTLIKCAALLEGLEHAEHRRRRRRKPQPKPPKD
jgi:hypothetical protein